MTYALAPRLFRLTPALSLLLFITVAARADFDAEVGGVKIRLGDDWESVQEATNFFAQQHARNSTRGILFRAGSFKVDLSLEQYAAIGIGSLTSGSDSQLDYVARQVGLPRSEVDKILASPAGKAIADQVRQASRTMRIELISITDRKIAGLKCYEVHSRVTAIGTGRTLYSRQFILPGAAPHEIVQINYTGVSKSLYVDKDLLDAIRPERKAE